MLKLKKTVLAVSGVALALAPVAPAAAVGPLFPWILGRHVIGAVVGLATLPFAVASSALSAGAVPPPPEYDGRAPAYDSPLAAASYYSRPPAYYARPRGEYRPGVSYARAAPRFYDAPRAYYAPRSRYTGAHGAHATYQPGRFAYRRR